MAKDPKTTAQSPSTEQPTQAANVTGNTAPTPAAGTDSRHVLVTLDSQYGDKSGSKVKRVDFIRDCYQNKKWSRGAITKEINRLNEAAGEKKIKYQIVFAATKGLPGGPDKPAAAPAASTAA